MKWQETLEKICSAEFGASLNVISGTDSYFRAVGKDPTVLAASNQMVQSGELREEVLDCIYRLSNEEVDPQFENPNDTALAVLLWLTYSTGRDGAEFAATYVTQAPHCWYAKRLAKRILNPAPSTVETYTIPWVEGAQASAYLDGLQAERADTGTERIRLLMHPMGHPPHRVRGEDESD